METKVDIARFHAMSGEEQARFMVEQNAIHKLETYFVLAGDEENNLDLFVAAETPTEAVELWRNYYGLEDESPRRVFTVPASTRMGVLEWHKDVIEIIQPLINH